MKTYALVNKSVVSEIVEIEDDLFQHYAKNNDSIIDITDTEPKPQKGWVLNGNKLQFPIGDSDREKLEIDLNEKKRIFGRSLCNRAVDRVGARNKILDKNGTQVTAILTQLLGIKALLETGALGTARYSCVQLKAVYTEYADIFDLVIQEINVFESTFGL